MNVFMTVGASKFYDLGGGVFQAIGMGQVDSDGTGPHLDKRDAQNQTTYQPSLNASKVPYVVTPPQFRKSQQTGVVIGCDVVVELLAAVGSERVIASTLAVCADVNNGKKFGEMSIECARRLGLPSSPVSGGTNELRVRYTFNTGKAALIDGIAYRLQPA